MNRPNAQYNVAKAGSLAVRVAAYARRRMYQKLLSRTAIQPEETLLDAGVTSDQSYEASNYIEAWYPHKARSRPLGSTMLPSSKLGFPESRMAEPMGASSLSRPAASMSYIPARYWSMSEGSMNSANS
jgi:hypothetical protein